MPQKTRKEKLTAQSRKRFQYTIVESPSSRAQTPSTHTETASHVVPKYEYAMTKEDALIKTFFIADLRKSLIFIGLILALEILLYFARINNYFS
jgi:hypothetical protein